MAVRTTAAAVGEICEVDATISLTPFIEAANALVTEYCASVTTYDATRLELIERWLSAHFYKMRELQVAMQKAGDTSESFTSQVALGFDNSTFGQMAMRLDSNGGLASLNEQSKHGGAATVGVQWGGIPEEDLTLETE